MTTEQQKKVKAYEIFINYKYHNVSFLNATKKNQEIEETLKKNLFLTYILLFTFIEYYRETHRIKRKCLISIPTHKTLSFFEYGSSSSPPFSYLLHFTFIAS